MSEIDRIRNFPSKLRTILAYFDEPVLITDPKGVLAYLNPRAEERFGVELKLAVGRNMTELLPAGVARALSDGVARVNKTPKNLKLLVEDSDPRYLAELNPIMQNSKLLGVVMSLRAESQDEVIARLNQSLFTNMVDEIYRPINQLTMLFSREFEERQGFEAFYHRSQDMVKQIIAALNNLVDISPVLIGEIRLARSRFQPSILLKLARRSFYARAEDKGVSLQRLEHRDLPEVMGDQAKLNRILIIFLDQMLNLAQPGEIVAISADVTLKPEPTLSYSLTTTGIYKTEKDFCCLTGDLSEGYAKEGTEDKLKERNMVIASRLLLAMKGKAQIASLDNVGTTLLFSVPVIIPGNDSPEPE